MELHDPAHPDTQTPQQNFPSLIRKERPVSEHLPALLLSLTRDFLAVSRDAQMYTGKKDVSPTFRGSVWSVQVTLLLRECPARWSCFYHIQTYSDT